MDSRESGPHLIKAAQAGVSLMSVPYEDHGLLTTPQLHFIVRCKNDPNFGLAKEIGYYTKISDAFKELLKLGSETEQSSYSPYLVLDCSNGVGAMKMRMLCRFIPETELKIEFRNENGELNCKFICLVSAILTKCGADYVKIEQMLPENFDDVDINTKCASLDGDADRLVYFRRKTKDSKKALLLDGDRIAVLIAKYVKEALNVAGITNLTVGVVQTAYANGNSTKFLREVVGITPVFVPTGVKHLHHAAVQFDIGIYFEANGHGTVVVGDALADLLVVESLLRWYGFSVIDWERQFYADAPSVQIKVPVADRSIFKTTYDETILIEPEGVQLKIDSLVEQYSEARAFVRPSGTENVVRIYAETQLADEAEALAESIAVIIRDLEE
ncbi:hypothetical protein DICVIV_07059 [Dictyocaulus viviparus]|uniref:Phosphoglucomutase/phosphomannomutase, alpha/beta/alpha domain II n=1 Tax=Dictyocaulus viviparus TaxID=29172 RepID=A0A0D8XQT0_DICVI|nr:hypothetical protein DICVIV_07059 [Dictyocaulus viviparus]